MKRAVVLIGAGLLICGVVFAALMIREKIWWDQWEKRTKKAISEATRAASEAATEAAGAVTETARAVKETAAGKEVE